MWKNKILTEFLGHTDIHMVYEIAKCHSWSRAGAPVCVTSLITYQRESAEIQFILKDFRVVAKKMKL